MKRMLALLGTTLMVLALASPLAGSENQPLTEDEMKLLANELVGPNDIVMHSIEDEKPNAWYAHPGFYCFDLNWALCGELKEPHILLQGMQNWPREAQIQVFLHELRHYIQRSNGQEGDEWDSDEWAAKLACGRFGHDARFWQTVIARLFSAAYDVDLGKVTSPKHGSLNQRIDNVSKIAECRERFDQSSGS